MGAERARTGYSEIGGRMLAAFVFLTLWWSIRAQQCSHAHHDDGHHHLHHGDQKTQSEKEASKIHDHGVRDHHGHSHGHDHHSHGRDGDHSHTAADKHAHGKQEFRLSEEIHEERELEMYGFDAHHHHEDHDHHDHGSLSKTALWLQAMGSSLLVSSASLVCLTILPLIVSHGQPSKGVVDALASFGAGTMLGDAFLHQLPHAFGGSGGHSHSETPHDAHGHLHKHDTTSSGGHSHVESHGHSLNDIAAGLAVLGGILLFFLVEKIVRRTEELSGRGTPFGHSHHHHHHHSSKTDIPKLKEEKQLQGSIDDDVSLDQSTVSSEVSNGLRKRIVKGVDEKTPADGEIVSNSVKSSEPKMAEKVDNDGKETNEMVAEEDGASRLVSGYLNLFSDAVHNFTDGMALGSAFLLHGTVGGWSRTLFLLAHELPQEIGDFGILVRSGFGVFTALAFNFLSALVALAGTALALLLGGTGGNSSLIEGFTAGGFIYIAVGSVMPDLHSQGSSLKTTLMQMSSLMVGMGVAVAISLAE